MNYHESSLDFELRSQKYWRVVLKLFFPEDDCPEVLHAIVREEVEVERARRSKDYCAKCRRPT